MELGRFADRVDRDRAAKHIVDAIGRELGGSGTARPSVGKEIRTGGDDAVGQAIARGIRLLGGLDFPQDLEGLRGLRTQMRAQDIWRRDGGDESHARDDDRDLDQGKPPSDGCAVHCLCYQFVSILWLLFLTSGYFRTLLIIAVIIPTIRMVVV